MDLVLDHTIMSGESLSLMVAPLIILWVYLPGFLVNTFAMIWGKWFPKTGYGPWPIDLGKNWRDGNRILGDGKTWNGLIGGSLTSGLLCIFQVWICFGHNNSSDYFPFVDPLTGTGDAWFSLGDWIFSAFILGTFLGFTSLLGDLSGSFIKRRRGLKREGDVSSKAPLLDTLPFAISLFIFGLLFLGESEWFGHLNGMIIILIITPVIHRIFNIIGYKIGWKDVPY